ncbi:hypothetical protein L1987_29674 [Smallanthus sonchifolius]|uniref:Uncharacterized protein n=1 Tax=Smallanthus sonchifolius TaxID=185202 RepID=A0ACB9I280_9ASTR|nr:hypothetical protein L1987_29674 [Smallanthus sonchifolius]
MVSFIPNSVPHSHLHRPPVLASYNRSIFQTCSRLFARSIFRPNLASLFDCSLLDCPLDFRPSHLVLIGFQHQCTSGVRKMLKRDFMSWNVMITGCVPNRFRRHRLHPLLCLIIQTLLKQAMGGCIIKEVPELVRFSLDTYNSCFRKTLRPTVDKMISMKFHPSRETSINHTSSKQRRRTSSAAALDALDDLLQLFKEVEKWAYHKRF